MSAAVIASKNGQAAQKMQRGSRNAALGLIDGAIPDPRDSGDGSMPAAFLENDAINQTMGLLALSSQPIMAWDFQTGVIDWNRGCEALFGYSKTEAIGKNPHELLGISGVSPEEIESKLLASRSWAGEAVYRAKGGRKLAIERSLELVPGRKKTIILEIGRDITEKRSTELRQRLLFNELAHRVKNSLAVVQAIAGQTLRQSPSPEAFVAAFLGRIDALATAHDVLARSCWEAADLGALIRNLLAPHVGDKPGRLVLKSSPFVLPARVATPLAMVIHELATNAAKYGALSDPKGCVEVSWQCLEHSRPRCFEMVWREKNGPPVEPKPRQGFGMRLIEEGVPGADVSLDFQRTGLLCRFRLSLSKRENL